MAAMEDVKTADNAGHAESAVVFPAAGLVPGTDAHEIWRQERGDGNTHGASSHRHLSFAAEKHDAYDDFNDVGFADKEVSMDLAGASETDEFQHNKSSNSGSLLKSIALEAEGSTTSEYQTEWWASRQALRGMVAVSDFHGLEAVEEQDREQVKHDYVWPEIRDGRCPCVSCQGDLTKDLFRTCVKCQIFCACAKGDCLCSPCARAGEWQSKLEPYALTVGQTLNEMRGHCAASAAAEGPIAGRSIEHEHHRHNRAMVDVVDRLAWRSLQAFGRPLDSNDRFLLYRHREELLHSGLEWLLLMLNELPGAEVLNAQSVIVESLEQYEDLRAALSPEDKFMKEYVLKTPSGHKMVTCIGDELVQPLTSLRQYLDPMQSQRAALNGMPFSRDAALNGLSLMADVAMSMGNPLAMRGVREAVNLIKCIPAVSARIDPKRDDSPAEAAAGRQPQDLEEREQRVMAFPLQLELRRDPSQELEAAASRCSAVNFQHFMQALELLPSVSLWPKVLKALTQLLARTLETLGADAAALEELAEAATTVTFLVVMAPQDAFKMLSTALSHAARKSAKLFYAVSQVAGACINGRLPEQVTGQLSHLREELLMSRRTSPDSCPEKDRRALHSVTKFCDILVDCFSDADRMQQSFLSMLEQFPRRLQFDGSHNSDAGDIRGSYTRTESFHRDRPVYKKDPLSGTTAVILFYRDEHDGLPGWCFSSGLKDRIWALHPHSGAVPPAARGWQVGGIVDNTLFIRPLFEPSFPCFPMLDCHIVGTGSSVPKKHCSSGSPMSFTVNVVQPSSPATLVKGLLVKSDHGALGQAVVMETLLMMRSCLLKDPGFNSHLKRHEIDPHSLHLGLHRVQALRPDLVIAEVNVEATSWRNVVQWTEKGDIVEPGRTQLCILNGNDKRPCPFSRCQTFGITSAIWFVFSFLLGLGDRHHENIMLGEDASYFHIDFACFLGEEPATMIIPVRTRIEHEVLKAVLGDELETLFHLTADLAFQALRPKFQLWFSQLRLASELKALATQASLGAAGATAGATVQKARAKAREDVRHFVDRCFSDFAKAQKTIRTEIEHCAAHCHNFRQRDRWHDRARDAKQTATTAVRATEAVVGGCALAAQKARPLVVKVSDNVRRALGAKHQLSNVCYSCRRDVRSDPQDEDSRRYHCDCCLRTFCGQCIVKNPEKQLHLCKFRHQSQDALRASPCCEHYDRRQSAQHRTCPLRELRTWTLVEPPLSHFLH